MFVKRHANELQDCIAVLNTDNGAGRPRGWYVNGRNDQRTRLAPHIGQDAVRQILRTATLDVDLVYSLWKP